VTSLQLDVHTYALCVRQDNATTALWNAMVGNPMAVKDFNRLNGSQLLILQLNTGTVLGKELAAGAIWKVCLFLCPHSYCCSCAHPYCMCGCICNDTLQRSGRAAAKGLMSDPYVAIWVGQLPCGPLRFK